jgi:FlaA1/EpsC-like NDP-sugar epimerase
VNAQSVRQHLIALPRRWKQAVLVLIDAGILLFALHGATRFASTGAGIPLEVGPGQTWLALLVAIPLFAKAGYYRTVIRFQSGELVLTTAGLLILTAALMLAAAQVLSAGAFSLSRAGALGFVSLALLGIVASRVLMRRLLHGHNQRRARRKDAVIVYGAGNAGARLLNALRESGRFRAVAAVDDNPDLHGRLLAGVPVWPPAELRRLTKDFRAQRILLAMPSVSRSRRQSIIDQLMDLNVRIQTVPDVADIIAGAARVDDLREVDALDLLGRNPVPPDAELLAACVTGKVVLVTGAGGSIGSELCRQIVQLKPRKLIILDVAEHLLYQVDRELRQIIETRALDFELVALLGSVHHRPRMERVMQVYGVQTVYHAAAYKHVPIVEQNMLEGVHNNIMGTWYAAEAAEAAAVETFVLISTDKAVMPTSVMGATKRAAEMTLQGMTRRGTRTRFCIVRFGNVLDSSGSVVPLFREQITRGGPVTVTDREVTRYFMTIPEAAQLVIQASALCKGGDVFVLDMGQPVKIYDLACRMILMMGKTIRDDGNPNGEIRLEFTGLRPGEKLYEELLIGSDVTATEHPKILRAMEESLPWPDTLVALQGLLKAAENLDCDQAVGLLREIVCGYQTGPAQVCDLTWAAARRAQPAADLSLDLVNGEARSKAQVAEPEDSATDQEAEKLRHRMPA